MSNFEAHRGLGKSASHASQFDYLGLGLITGVKDRFYTDVAQKKDNE